ncbi:hypothetical protein ACH5RR_010524 [Cinchona calisaya]|uniref:RRM domain-containing protein n=1 Tax=Cinchona calisaya TaxID=153742 RepID=A0ABD3AJ56_9GENT
MDFSATEEGKLFVGGIAWETKEDNLKDYFTQHGEVTHAAIVRDRITGQSRGFGFVVFSDPTILDSILQENHSIDGRLVEVKRAISREDQQSSRSSDPNASNGNGDFGGQGNHRTKKIFVGGLPSELTKGEFTQHFQNYGCITDAVIMFDRNNGKSRGFGFITFDTEDAVDRVLNKTFHELNNKFVEVKRALPKETNPGHGARGKSYKAYASYGARTDTFNSQMERLLHPQPAAVGYPLYFGYGTPSYGCGLANNIAVYGGLGVYAFGSYENATAGYGGSAFRHGALGYGLNADYVVTVPWTSPDSTSLLGQSPKSTPINNGYRGSEGSCTDSARSRTLNRHRSMAERNAGQNAVEAGDHGAGGSTRRTYARCNGSSKHSDAA